jgi:hypothetical protein
MQRQSSSLMSNGEDLSYVEDLRTTTTAQDGRACVEPFLTQLTSVSVESIGGISILSLCFFAFFLKQVRSFFSHMTSTAA